ncbi:MAG TPA: YciI family protein [Actinomycetota bacterium]|nr:YciI family protein [Actinomycetota bacterium]
MKYALLIYDDPKAWADADEASRSAMMEEYGKFWDDLDKKGMIRGGQQLAPHTSATVVSAENGTTLTTDGPYAETKEQLGGFFVIECGTLDEAIEAASQIPSLKIGGQVEVRPIVDM